MTCRGDTFTREGQVRVDEEQGNRERGSDAQGEHKTRNASVKGGSHVRGEGPRIARSGKHATECGGSYRLTGMGKNQKEREGP